MSEVSIERIDDAQAFMARWREMYARAHHATFFQSPDWMEAWLQEALKRAQVFRVEAQSGDGLAMMGVVGAAARRPAFFGLKEARFFESGDPALDAVYIEYADFLSAAGADPALRGTMIGKIADRFGDADTIVFRNLREPMTEAVRAFARQGFWTAKTLREQPVYAVDLAAIRDAGQGFVDSLESASLRNKIRRAMRGYEERGPLSCRTVQQGQWDAAWRRLAALHEARWRAAGEAGAFANDAFLTFHERLKANAPEACELLEIACGADVIGVLYNFRHGDRIMNYQSGFRQEDDNKLTPGFVCHALACQHYLETGVAIYDLLAGDEEYKQRLGAPTQTLTSIALERPSWRIKARNVLKGLASRRAEESVEHDDAP